MRSRSGIDRENGSECGAGTVLTGKAGVNAEQEIVLTGKAGVNAEELYW
jgi:hypothetical protein